MPRSSSFRRQRKAILLREWQGLSYADIAEQLDLTLGAVETLLFRARGSLMRHLRGPRARLGLLDLASVGSLLRSVLGGTTGKVAVGAATLAVVATPVVEHELATPVARADRVPVARLAHRTAAHAAAPRARHEAARAQASAPRRAEHSGRSAVVSTRRAVRPAAPATATPAPPAAAPAPLPSPTAPSEDVTVPAPSPPAVAKPTTPTVPVTPPVTIPPISPPPVTLPPVTLPPVQLPPVVRDLPLPLP